MVWCPDGGEHTFVLNGHEDWMVLQALRLSEVRNVVYSAFPKRTRSVACQDSSPGPLDSKSRLLPLPHTTHVKECRLAKSVEMLCLPLIDFSIGNWLTAERKVDTLGL
ncbi:hypothetical protein Bbelb_276830 [Branchiostoma belcheri]|nr:hypothetical protein Bbelb_276830 [Branchiostoma belcheri]